MQRREHEMPGLGCGEGGRDRLDVAYLSDKDDVGVLAKHVPKRLCERERVRAHLAWLTIAVVWWWRNSIGSSTVMMCKGLVWLMMLIRDASVVVLPAPVGPVTRTSPRRSSAKDGPPGARASEGRDLVGMVRSPSRSIPAAGTR